jgi:hypothetical protein
MVHPDLFADPDFMPPAKGLLFVGMMSVAEDSGCLPWRPELLKGLTLPLSEISSDQVAAYMTDLVNAGRAWTYERSGREYAFLPDFPSWQGKLIRWNAPDTVPLPSGITFENYDAKERNGSGIYTWPESREELDPKALEELDPTSLEGKDVISLDLKEPASTQPATSELPEDDAEAIPVLMQRLSKARADQALQSARDHAKKSGKELTDSIVRFCLEAEAKRTTP